MGAVISKLLQKLGGGRVLLAVLVAAVAIGLTWGYVSTRNENTRLRGSEIDLRREVQVERRQTRSTELADDVREFTLEELKAKEAAANEERTRIAKENNDWSGQPVPDAIRERLRQARSTD